MSLGLVAYGSSDESDGEVETNSVVSTVKRTISSDTVNNDHNRPVLNASNSVVDGVSSSSVSSLKNVSYRENRKEKVETVIDDELPVNVNKSNGLLSSLPVPKTTKLHDIDFDWDRLSNKRSSQPIKISVPSLSTLDSEDQSDEPQKKKLKPSKAGSGLFALLPSPKNVHNQLKTLKPQQIKSKPPTKQTTVVPTKSISGSRNIQLKNIAAANYDDSPDEEEDGDYSKVDFFSLSSPVNVPASASEKFLISAEIDGISAGKTFEYVNDAGQKIGLKESVNSLLSKKSEPEQQLPVSGLLQAATSEADHVFVGPSLSNTFDQFRTEQADIQLDETAMSQLCGRRERQKAGSAIQLIDVKGDMILPDSSEWLTKQLTEEQNTNIHSHKKRDGPTTQQRRKHQITYLAFQAKEHELELKNQWANNRMSRKQTQAKYGF